MKRRYWLALTIIIQVIMIFIAYKPFILQPNDYLFDNKFDGLKSLFCWYSYIFYDTPRDAFHYSMMNYPFGEYVFYPDNTPIYCIILRWIQNLGIVDLEPYAFAIHHYLFLSGFLVSCILLFLLLENLITSYFLITLASLVLPWINPQFIRIEFHFNLAYSWILILQLLLTIKQYKALAANDVKKWWRLLIVQGVLLWFMPLFHMYYLAINYAFLGCFWFFYWLWQRDKRSFKVFVAHVAVYTVSAVLLILFVSHFDQFYSLRSGSSPGYDWINWKWRPENLFLRNPWFEVPFIYNYKIDLGYETFAYLGAFALYGAFLIPVFFYLRKKLLLTIPLYLKLFMLAGVVMLFIAFGEHIIIGKNDHSILNIFNPLFYFRQITEMITHFRCTGRFGWYFFWTFNLLILFIVDSLLRTSGSKWKHLLWLFPILLAIDGITTVKWSARPRDPNLFTKKDEMEDIKELFKGIDVSKYQAILPIPYFHGLCSDYDYTIDPDDYMCRMAFQASFLTHLPLMASKIARVPDAHAKALLETVANNKIDPSVSALLNDKPILVLINDERYANGWKPSVPKARELYDKQTNFYEDQRLIQVKAYKSFRLKEWHWQKHL